MDKKELKQAYKEVKARAGVFQVVNTKNGKVYVESNPNMDGAWNRLCFELNMDTSFDVSRKRTGELAEEWKKFGQEAFRFEVLEILKIKDDPGFNRSKELTALEEKWLAKLEPYDGRGYNLRR
jgi:hypothetical protein